jgi:hypothetical protein
MLLIVLFARYASNKGAGAAGPRFRNGERSTRIVPADEPAYRRSKGIRRSVEDETCLEVEATAMMTISGLVSRARPGRQ